MIGVGANLGDRMKTLEAAARALQALSPSPLLVSPIYENPALLPENGPDSWRIPFLNAVIEVEWSGSPQALLGELKKIERGLGRTEAPRWAPRVIDLDLLTFGDLQIAEPALQIPHPGLLKRSFVLDPLKDIKPNLFKSARACAGHAPAWVGILNVTPDSFSDGGELAGPNAFERRVERWMERGVQVFDIGAESTRPGARPLSTEEEWARLKPALEILRSCLSFKNFKPLVSVDTRHPETARRALDYGVNWINDVSGLHEAEGMIEVLKKSRSDYVLMHSLSVPANPDLQLPAEVDVVDEIKTWALKKIDVLEGRGISLERIIFDPGIGFGKTAQASITILKRIEELLELPVRVLVGHSRKGFLKTWSAVEISARDPETMGVSLQLANRGVDYIRVHDPEIHARVFHAYRESAPVTFT